MLLYSNVSLSKLTKDSHGGKKEDEAMGKEFAGIGSAEFCGNFC